MSTHMSPLQHPRGHAPSLGPVHRLHWGHTLAQPWSERPPPQDSCTRGLTKKRVFPGYPPTLQGTHMAPLQHPWGHTPSLRPGLWQRSAAGPPKTPILGNPGALSPKVSLKNEFSLGTHQAGWVPTCPLYNIHGVTPLALALFIGYTGVIPLLNHGQNDPHPRTLVPEVSLKNEFSQDTHLPCRVPTWPLYNTHGVTPLAFAPVSGNEALPDPQKHPFWVTPGHFRPRSP